MNDYLDQDAHFAIVLVSDQTLLPDWSHYPGPPPLITLTWSPHLCNSSLRLKLHQLHWIKTFQQGIMCKQTSSPGQLLEMSSQSLYLQTSVLG